MNTFILFALTLSAIAADPLRSQLELLNAFTCNAAHFPSEMLDLDHLQHSLLGLSKTARQKYHAIIRLKDDNHKLGLSESLFPAVLPNNLFVHIAAHPQSLSYSVSQSHPLLPAGRLPLRALGADGPEAEGTRGGGLETVLLQGGDAKREGDDVRELAGGLRRGQLVAAESDRDPHWVHRLQGREWGI